MPNTNQLRALINASQGRFFTAIFIKKDGSTRALNGRIGVSKHTTGEGLKFDPISRGLITVYDVKHKGYRMIKLARLKAFKSGKLSWSADLNPVVLSPMERYEANGRF